MSKTCLVTGGAGFIGSHLVEELLEKGHRVICADNFSSGAEKNIQHLKGKENFVMLKHDMKEPIKVDEDIDYVFHLASRASPIDYQKHQIDTIITNGLGTFNALELARKKNARYMASSTSEVYGDPEQHPQKETYWGNVNPVGIRSCYDEGKRFAEALAMAFMREVGTDIRLARIFNTYGPRMRANDGRVIPNFVNQALEGKPITVYGDGSQTRSFCYVSDMVDGLQKLMFTENIKGEVVNLGNPKENTIKELAEIVKKLTGSDSEIVHKPLPKDDPTRRNPDISKAKEVLNWEPKVGLEEGLKKVIEYFKK